MTYSPVTKAAIDAADEFIEALDEAWADIDDSFDFDDKDSGDKAQRSEKSSTVCSLNSVKHIPKDVHIQNTMEIVSPLAESHRINRVEETNHKDELKNVRTELSMLKKEMETLQDKEQCSEIEIEDVQHENVCSVCKERSSKAVVDKGIDTNDENIPPSNDIESVPKESLEAININLQKKIDQLEDELHQTFQKNTSLEKELYKSESQILQMEQTMLVSKTQQNEMRENYCNRIKELIQQNLRSQKHVKMAEEDANMALNMAKESDAKRCEMELALETVVKELELLKGVHVEENPMDQSAPIQKQFVWKTVGGKDSASILDGSDGSSAFSLESLDNTHSPMNVSVRNNDTTYNKSNALDDDVNNRMIKVHDIIRTSGMHLNLPGKWFSKSRPSGIDVHTESISKSYCVLVENIIHQQRDELKELKEFCSYLEGKLVG
jgi:myosin heavy subunit